MPPIAPDRPPDATDTFFSVLDLNRTPEKKPPNFYSPPIPHAYSYGTRTSTSSDYGTVLVQYSYHPLLVLCSSYSTRTNGRFAFERVVAVWQCGTWWHSWAYEYSYGTVALGRVAFHCCKIYTRTVLVLLTVQSLQYDLDSCSNWTPNPTILIPNCSSVRNP